MLYQRYVWTTANDYTVTDDFHVTSNNIFHSGDLAVNNQTTWAGVSASSSVPIRLLDGTYVSAQTDLTSQTIATDTKLVNSTTNQSASNSTLETTLFSTNPSNNHHAPPSLPPTS